MKITRDNYEIFFIDYWDGNLTPEQSIELLDFLELNYDLKEEFDSFENLNIIADNNIKFDNKESLKKPEIIETNLVNSSNYTDFFIAKLEGDLSIIEEAELNIFLSKNSNLLQEFNLFQSTKVVADNSIQFSNKDSLKKKEIVETALIYNANYLDFFIGKLEGDLKLNELQELSNFLLLNPSLKNEFDQIQSVKLVSDETIVYSEKDKLKKKPVFVLQNRNLVYSLSIAASLLLLIGIYFLLNNRKIEKEQNFAHSLENKTQTVHKINIGNSSSEIEKVDNNYSNSQTQINQNNSNKVRNEIAFEPIKSISNHSIYENNISLDVENSQRTYYMDISEDAKLLASAYATVENSQIDNRPSFKERTVGKIKNIIKPNQESSEQPSKITFWDVADLGLNGVNKIVNKDFRLQREVTDGKTSAVALVSDELHFSRKIKK
ncbi:MAG: hypothetical protein HXX09_13655 [Bacteroidetes bacterium]|nr:hypothetical protein [Bacteroidota bacterium]